MPSGRLTRAGSSPATGHEQPETPTQTTQTRFVYGLSAPTPARLGRHGTGAGTVQTVSPTCKDRADDSSNAQASSAKQSRAGSSGRSKRFLSGAQWGLSGGSVGLSVGRQGLSGGWRPVGGGERARGGRTVGGGTGSGRDSRNEARPRPAHAGAPLPLSGPPRQTGKHRELKVHETLLRRTPSVL